MCVCVDLSVCVRMCRLQSKNGPNLSDDLVHTLRYRDGTNECKAQVIPDTTRVPERCKFIHTFTNQWGNLNNSLSWFRSRSFLSRRVRWRATRWRLPKSSLRRCVIRWQRPGIILLLLATPQVRYWPVKWKSHRIHHSTLLAALDGKTWTNPHF